MYRYVGHVVSAIEKPDSDQLLKSRCADTDRERDCPGRPTRAQYHFMRIRLLLNAPQRPGNNAIDDGFRSFVICPHTRLPMPIGYGILCLQLRLQ